MVKFNLNCFQVLFAAGVRFHFLAAAVRMQALVMMVVPMLMSCSYVYGLLLSSDIFAYLCMMLKTFVTGLEGTYL